MAGVQPPAPGAAQAQTQERPEKARAFPGRKMNKSPPNFRSEGFLMRSLTVTYFHRKYNRLSSAQRRFTVLFGMGRSGTTLLWPSGKGFVSSGGAELDEIFGKE